MINSILVPTDFSACADKATKLATVLARKAGSQIIFFHTLQRQSVVSHIPHIGHFDPIAVEEEKQARAQLHELATTAQSAGIEAKTLLGDNSGKIEDTLSQADIVVIGSHGKKGFGAFMVGSYTERVLKQSPVPVIVVEQLAEDPKIKSIAFASTFKDDKSGPLDQVVELGKLWNAQINILQVKMNDPTLDEEADRMKIKELIKKYKDVSFTINSIGTNDEEWGVAQFVKLIPTDLIAISKAEFDEPFRIISGNKAELLATDAHVLVMVI
jgi:nucleotide-binding universal stress UspA family protein